MKWVAMSAESRFLPPTDDDPFGRAAAVRPDAAGTPLAGFWARAGAVVIDALVLIAVTTPLSLAFAGDDGRAPAGVTLLVLLASLLYAPLLMARSGAANGQTWGKQAVGVRVVREDGQAVTFGTGTVREVVGKGLLGLAVLPTLASLVMVAVREDKKAIHDLLAGTRVVRG
jgi:uncharacterized RDD family membrane protein YckC